MRLPGSLRHTTLGDILGMLHRARSRGVLEIIERSGFHMGRMHRVHLDAGLVHEVESPAAVARIGDILEQQGYIGEGTKNAMTLNEGVRQGKRIGEWLVESRTIGREAVLSALRQQRLAKLEQLFRLRDVRLAFRVWLPRIVAHPLDVLSPAEFLHGRPRTRDNGSSPRRWFSRRDPERVRALAALDLEEPADAAEVNRAFRRLAATLHPDRFPDATASQRSVLMRRFAEITAAYHYLNR